MPGPTRSSGRQDDRIRAKGEEASCLRIAATRKAFIKDHRYTQPSETTRRPYPAKVAVDQDQQSDAHEDADDEDADADSQYQVEYVLKAGPI